MQTVALRQQQLDEKAKEQQYETVYYAMGGDPLKDKKVQVEVLKSVIADFGTLVLQRHWTPCQWKRVRDITAIRLPRIGLGGSGVGYPRKNQCELGFGEKCQVFFFVSV